jgi:O-succinylbenzoic acid--CoA ligase
VEDIITKLEYLSDRDWLYGHETREFYRRVRSYYDEWNGRSLSILLAESEPFEFLAIFLAAVAARCSVFLANPAWRSTEWKQIFSLVNPDLVFGNTVPAMTNSTLDKKVFSPSILIPTGGTSGNIRFAIHTLETFSASVFGFRDYFEIDRVNSFCVLPLYHVSGLMQFLRCFLTGGNFIAIPYSKLKRERVSMINLPDYFISLVPTQLQFLLETDPAWLSSFRAVLLGGASPWPDLLEQARRYRIPLALTYGMTETASQIVTLKPEDFLSGNNSNGRVLPHAAVEIDRPTGLITIKSKSLFQGYYPDRSLLNSFTSDDIGYFDENYYLYIIGRNSQKIITGGENVFPVEVEIAVRDTGLVKDVAVAGVPDSRWGQAIVAYYVPLREEIASSAIVESVKNKIAGYKQPKYWIALEEIPRNLQGKINSELLSRIWIARSIDPRG